MSLFNKNGVKLIKKVWSFEEAFEIFKMPFPNLIKGLYLFK